MGDDPYQKWLEREAELLLSHDEGHLYHDELAETNQPFTSFNSFRRRQPTTYNTWQRRTFLRALIIA